VSGEIVEAASWRVVAHAEPNHLQMSRTYQVLNADLSHIVARYPIRIRHVTGEARVLVDPAHRNVIALNKAGGITTRIACRQSTPKIVDAYSFIAAQRSRWSKITWADLIDIVALCAHGAIRISILDKPAEVHYSLFGSNRILLQEPHEHPSEQKRVWYLESSDLVRALADRISSTFDDAYLLPPTTFDALLQWLFSARIYPLVGARGLTTELYEGLSEADVDSLISLGILERAPRDSAIPLKPLLEPDLEGWTSRLLEGKHG
jgi:hypothetical protein